VVLAAESCPWSGQGTPDQHLSRRSGWSQRCLRTFTGIKHVPFTHYLFSMTDRTGMRLMLRAVIRSKSLGGSC